MRIAPPVTVLRGFRPEASPQRRTPGIRGRARQRSSAGPVSNPQGCPCWPRADRMTGRPGCVRPGP